MSANLIINSTTAATSVVDPLGEDGTIEWIMSKIDQFPIKLSFIFSCGMFFANRIQSNQSINLSFFSMF